MDFYQIKEKYTSKGVLEIYPDFKVTKSNDLMIRGKNFYAIWDDENQIWSADEYDVQRIIDKDLLAYKEEKETQVKSPIHVKLMSDFSSGIWKDFKSYVQNLSDNAKQLDEVLTFQNTIIKKKDYVSKRLPYALSESAIDAYEELISTLYLPEEREKIEWAIGAVISGDAKHIQKFIVLYGEAGTGKSTVLNIIQNLFEGYYTTFEAKALTSSNNTFATEVFKQNPLIAIQHDGDLSRIEDNTKLNSIVSHEMMTMNEKYKASYMSRINAFLFMATNKPVKITDAKSGIIRRLIDVKPSGNKVSVDKYYKLMDKMRFELGGIAYHCLNVYTSLGKNYYSRYKPLEMIFTTDVFFNFVEANYFIFKDQDNTTLTQAYEMYKVYCEESLVDFKLPKYKFREELKNYFREFHQIARIDGKQVRSFYAGFIEEKFTNATLYKEEKIEDPSLLRIINTKSLFDDIYKDQPAQYANKAGTPKEKWENVTTTLADIDTSKLHYVKLPLHHIVIDFDLKDEKGNKSLEKNLEEANKWPKTYAELSKSGKGVHLHYIYKGDPEQLVRLYSEDIEIKVFVGNSSLRRKLSFCNEYDISVISSGLPQRGKKMINFEAVKSEKKLRALINKNLKKEIHAATKPSIDFIHKLLEDAYESGLSYDVSDMRNKILAFANNSTNQSEYCVRLVSQMKFKSENEAIWQTAKKKAGLIFFDVEVFPNLFVVVWKKEGAQSQPVAMINPDPSEIEELLKFNLVGFNCRRYDNHILYARYIGYDNKELFLLSQKIINGSKNATFAEAYNLSYTDIYDVSSKKQSLKKFQIELGLQHAELNLKWDEPVPKEQWNQVVEYCKNDVITTEQVFYSRKQDFIARQILADLSGLSVNHTTQNHTAKIIFGNDPKPQEKFIYTDLSETFSGYTFERGKSLYRGEDPKEGGYVYAEPGMYTDVALLDVASMHPTSLINMNMFGPYTKKYKELMDIRLAIKHKDFDIARQMLGGVVEKYLGSEKEAEDLSYALKIIINIVYGLTSASFDNKFRDIRNIDNIVAKRGSLFMIDLKHTVQDMGYIVAHIKTDSIKIPNADKKIIDFIIDFGKQYGYEFEHEKTYDKFCLVNDAVYIARAGNSWDAVGAQFAHPYVYKTLFSKEPIEFKDLCEVKTVSTALYLDYNEDLPEGEHTLVFVGKAGSFCPIQAGKGGGLLLREKDDKYYAATGSKGYRWMESAMVQTLQKEDDIDLNYFDVLVDEAIKTISKFGDFKWFIE